MGLDGVELIMAVEERFGIEIPDSEAYKLTTPRKLIDFIASQLNTISSTSTSCLSQIGFYRVRRSIINMTGLHKKVIRPSTPIEEVIPVVQRRRKWSELQQNLNVGMWPRLVRPTWLYRTLWCCYLLCFLVLLCYFESLNSSVLNVCFSAAIVGVIAVIIFLTTTKYVIHFQPAGYTVGDLARIVVANIPEESFEKILNREDIAAVTRGIIMEQLGITNFRDDDRFLEDLGVD